MTDPVRPRRADATRNYAQVLDAAFEVFAAHGTQAPISEIARRAGVGPGTIYRHFPTKEDLFRAVVADRFGRVVEYAQQVRADQEPGEAFLTFLRTLILDGSENRALADAIIGSKFDVLDAESPFLDSLAELLSDAQGAGSVREDVGVMEIKALLAACYMVRSYGDHLVEPVMNVVFDGLTGPRASQRTTNDKNNETKD